MIHNIQSSNCKGMRTVKKRNWLKVINHLESGRGQKRKLIKLLESGTFSRPVPGLYACSTIVYKCCFAWARYHLWLGVTMPNLCDIQHRCLLHIETNNNLFAKGVHWKQITICLPRVCTRSRSCTSDEPSRYFLIVCCMKPKCEVSRFIWTENIKHQMLTYFCKYHEMTYITLQSALL